jgi:spore germination protein KC
MKIKKMFHLLFLIQLAFFMVGCWDYRDVEKLGIVAGFAIDKVEDEYQFSAEIIDIKGGGKSTEISSLVVSATGKTIFEADRKIIGIVGRKLYFNHAEVVIISKEIAEEGIAPVLDWISRDPEPRYTLHLIISNEKTAKEILEKSPAAEDIKSYKLDDTLEMEKYLSETPSVELWQLLTVISGIDKSGILPIVALVPISNGVTQELKGTAVFKDKKMLGVLDDEDTKTLLFILGEIKEGLLENQVYDNNTANKVTVEIFENKTHMKPTINDDRPTMKITTYTEVTISEIQGPTNFDDPEKMIKLKQNFEEMLENKIVQLVKKVQALYNTDIFGFGKAIKIKTPTLWKNTFEPNWDQYFPTIQVEVQATIEIRSSNLINEPVR